MKLGSIHNRKFHDDRDFVFGESLTMTRRAQSVSKGFKSAGKEVSRKAWEFACLIAAPYRWSQDETLVRQGSGNALGTQVMCCVDDARLNGVDRSASFIPCVTSE